MNSRFEQVTGWRSILGGSRRRLWIVALGVVGLAAFVLVWFQPQKLFIDERVDQAVPRARPNATSAPSSDGDQSGGEPNATMPPEPIDHATGSFVSLDHTSRGDVRLLGLADGRRFVRLEGFETENGPDLFVYLSSNPADGPEAAFDDEFVNLGRLQGNIGDQNYEIPADADPRDYSTVVVWCDRFNSAFGAADLSFEAG